MMMRRIVLSAVCTAMCAANSFAADGWGSVTGQIVVNGEVPKRALLHAKGAPIKDAAVCAAADTYSDDVVVDKDSKGIANAFVYLAKAPTKVHADLQKPAAPKVVFDQKGCAFIPHSLVVRAGQTVEVISSDAIAHNTHTYPLRNNAVNNLVAPNTPAGSGIDIACPTAERLPFQVKCDYHPWMMAYWLVLDHPYAAVTDKDGKFTIANLPEGDHELVIWHEKVGYVERKFKVTVKNGAVTETKPVAVESAKLTAG